jgi:dTMP kinase
MAARGRLVVLEGIDGCGKSTQARRLAASLPARCTAEPGGTPLGQELRRLLLDPDLSPPAARTEALLMVADRAEHVATVVEPALAAGHWVVADRFTPSTLAYQGYGRLLDLDVLRAVSGWAAAGVEPDLVVLLDLPVDVARRRLAGAAPDRLERLDEAFHRRVAAGYRALAQDTASWAVVDGRGPEEEVAAAVLAVTVQRLGRPEVEATS